MPPRSRGNLRCACSLAEPTRPDGSPPAAIQSWPASEREIRYEARRERRGGAGRVGPASVAPSTNRSPHGPRTPEASDFLGPVLAILNGAEARGPHACAGEVFGDRGHLAVGVLADLGQ